jgi:protein arginine N-methyltransferase 1
MYKISDYGKMISDRIRTDAYFRALQQTVNPDSVVIDIGAGSGILSLFACKLGARKVYAIEPSDAIQLAIEFATANGYSDRIEFLQRMSTEVNLPEQGDIIVSDIRGVLPMHGHSLLSIVDARTRLLARSGIMIPMDETLWASVVADTKLYSRCSGPWTDNPYGLNLHAGRRMVTNTWWRARVDLSQLLTAPKCWYTLDYATLESPDVRGKADWTVEKDGTGYGLAVWFDTNLVRDVSFSNGPHAPEVIYGSGFFPWSEPAALQVGDTVTVKLAANLVGRDYIWQWETLILDQGDPARIKADFKQSTFFGTSLSPSGLHKRASSYIPSLNDEGEIDRFVLTHMDGTKSSEEITLQLTQLFPNRFATFKDALTRVTDLAEKYGSSSDPN